MATSSPRKTATGPVIKYTIEHYRKDGVSEEAFQHWFHNVVLPKAFPVLQRHNIVKFTIYKTDLQVSAAFQSVVNQLKPGWKVSDCDIVVEYWVNDLESMQNLNSDPEWVGTVLKDQDDWFDNSRSNIHIGYDTTYLENGAIKSLA